jgi:hypothetical protein
MPIRLTLLGLLLWFPANIPPAVRTGKPHPSLAGTWTLNPELSKTAEPGFGMGRRRPGGEGGGGEPGGEFPREPSFGGSRGLGELLRPKPQLTISETDTLLTVTDDAGWIRELIPNGVLMREELGQGGPADILTRWKDAKLIAERRLDAGGTYSETYELDRKSGRLRLTVSFKTPRMSRGIGGTRVYDRN